MSIKRNFSDSDDCRSDSAAEMKEVSLHRPTKKKKICLESDSENESVLSDMNTEKDENSSSVSEEDEPLSTVADLSKVEESNQNISSPSETSDDEPLTTKSKIPTKEIQLKANKNIINIDCGSEKIGFEASSDDEPISRITKASKLKRNSKKFSNSSDSSDDADKINNSSKHTESKRNAKNLYSEADENESDESSVEDEHLNKIAKGKSEEKSSTSSDDEPLANKTKISTKKLKTGKIAKKFNLADDWGTSEEGEPVSKILKSKESKFSTSSYSSDDEPLAVKGRSSKSLEINKKVKNLDSESGGSKSEVSSDEEPVSQIMKSSKTSEISEVDTSLSNSEDGILAAKASKQVEIIKDKNQKSHSITNGHNAFSNEEQTVSKLANDSKKKEKPRKKHNSRNSSHDEPLATKISVKKKSKVQENSDPSSDEEKPPRNLAKTSKGKTNQKRAENSSNDRIEHVKKYLRITGIHIKSYDKLFEGCKSIKSKTEKLLGLLQANGLKGRPTIEKCKKLRKKIETKKEIAELNTSNIIKSEGRPKRGSSRTIEKVQNTEVKTFSQLQDIIDSEDSD